MRAVTEITRAFGDAVKRATGISSAAVHFSRVRKLQVLILNRGRRYSNILAGFQQL
jgi:hypothetical protein